MKRLSSPTLNVSGFLDEFEKDRVKQNVDIVSLFTSFGVKLEKKGKSFVGLCPFHDDSDPSLSVDKEKGLFHCFGCGASGDAFDLVMKMKGVGFREALSFLKGEDLKPPEAPASKASDPDRESEEKPLLSVSLSTITRHYEKNLKPGSKAAEYLETRGLLDWGLLERLQAGYAPGTLKTKLTEGQLEGLKELGIFTDRGREAFSGCVVFPLLDENDQVVGLYGRKTGKSKVNHLYLKGPHRGIFNRKAFSVYPERIIFTEGILDALSLLVLGIENVTALYGAGGLTEDHLKALKDNRTKEVVLALDNDEAGRTASEKLKEKLLEEGLSVRVIFPETAKDWNEVILTSSLEREELKSSLLKRMAEAELFSAEKLPARRVEVKNGKHYFHLTDILYRLIGVKEGFISSLKVNIRAEKDEEKHIDNVDLFSARSRSSFSLVLGRLFHLEAARVEKDLVYILEWLEEERDRKLLGLDSEERIELTEAEKQLGLSLLSDPKLFDRIEEDLSALGYVGEACNKQLMYLAASSRKLLDPISIIVISQSAAGKSYLIDTVKKLMPPEEVLSMTSLSDQALNYLPEESLLHKFLIMGEAVHSDAIDHQMREMLSARELSRLVTTKNEKTGKMESRLVHKKAVVSAVMSSASGDINPENASRCFVISTDESEEQTRAIHRQQRRKYSLDRQQEKKDQLPEIIKIHHAAQRLLRSPLIINPFAESLDFPASLMRSRRDHERFIDLIAVVCFLRQFQKEEHQHDGARYIECDLEDYRIAYRIMMNILPSTLSSFPKSAQMLFERLREQIRSKADREGLSFNEVSVTQREVRESTGLSHDVVKWNLRHLVEYEYVRKTGGARRGQSAHYRIDRDEDINHLLTGGIPSPEELQKRLVGKSGVKWGNKPKAE